MTPRSTLLESWRERLAENEALARDGSSRLRWLRLVQVRLYSFLLSRYGGGRWRPEPPEDECQPPREHSFSMLKSVEVGKGTPPKSIGRIRATLKAVHAAGPETPAGSYRPRRLHVDYWYPVGSINLPNEKLITAFRAIMQENELACLIKRSGRGYIFQTHYADRHRARELLAKLKSLYPTKGRLIVFVDEPSHPGSAILGGYFLGMLAGLTVFCATIVPFGFGSAALSGSTVAITFITIGALLGLRKIK
jgi:hypothetical protein